MDVDEISTTPGSIMSSSKTYSTTVQTQNGLYNSYIDADFNENDSYNTIFAVLLKSSIPKILSSSAALFIITVNIIWIGHHSTPSEFAGVLLTPIAELSMNISDDNVEKYNKESSWIDTDKKYGTQIAHPIWETSFHEWQRAALYKLNIQRHQMLVNANDMALQDIEADIRSMTQKYIQEFKQYCSSRSNQQSQVSSHRYGINELLPKDCYPHIASERNNSFGYHYVSKQINVFTDKLFKHNEFLCAFCNFII
eukprot:838526_1